MDIPPPQPPPPPTPQPPSDDQPSAASGLPSDPRPHAGPQPQAGQQGPFGQAPFGQAPYGQPPFPPQDAYGQGPQGPYPPPYQQYWYPPPPAPSMNGMAIASFVLAVSCVPVLGVVFGIVALAQIRKRGQQGKALAIAGVSVSGVATLFLAVMITLGVTGALDNGTRTDDLRTGQCFNLHGDPLSESSGESKGVDVVPCAEEHDAETFGVTSLSHASSEYPGDSAAETMADSQCRVLAEDYLKDSDRSIDLLDIYYSLPRESGWSRGDRRVTCFFGDGGRKMTGSVKSSPGDPGASA
ncbi:DUF4190 domain-containing protein [Streptomyces sp. H39-S7]|uniref:DUF4190 domain-containing protein n=1 Tax=Streptomyces sp. H39-S7 TaxID=3004357 RepID=UPI0022B04CAF|nr:DUF4190 domain-containing protein [Streptomyces sp. H39-S7]MCZ4120008.1 septum formation family protein [Streptomyces sp. H39-S7]